MVDLAALLVALHERYGARVVRVDSGGALNGALLEAGLVDEISLLMHPVLVPSEAGRPWHGGGSGHTLTTSLVAAEILPDGVVWLRHSVTRGQG
ncbi:MAG TPA: dihydrofolate reductase family protein [Marmoricola sp.]|nr:dihydrofolate reductase family protein [Marmoricola sp.]